MTTRRHGVDFFVAALRAWSDRDKRLRTKPKRRKKADRERILLRRVQWLDDLLHRAMADLEKAVVNGWRDNVLNALKAEMENVRMLDATDDATDAVPVSEGRAARADHHSTPHKGRQTVASEHAIKQPALRCGSRQPRWLPMFQPERLIDEPAHPHGIYLGDTRQLIARVPSESVNLIETSPPYPGRPGGVHPDEFVAWWLPFADQFWRVLHPSGSLGPEHPGALHRRRAPYVCAKLDHRHAP